MVEIVRFQELNEVQVERVARLHREELVSLLAEMGTEFARRFYQIACSDDETIGFCALDVSGEVLGFVMGHPQPWVLSSRLQHPLGWFLWQAALSFLRNPQVVLQILESRRENLSQNVYDEDTSVLLFIIVARQAQSLGVGSALMERYVATSRERGFNKVALSVDTDNNQAVLFYQKLGFTVRDRVEQGRYERDRLELDITRNK